MHLHFAKRVVAKILTNRVFNLKSVCWLALLFPIVTASPAFSQYQDRYGQSQTRICQVQGGRFVCGPRVPDPFGLPPSPTLESLARERAEMQNRQGGEQFVRPALSALPARA